MLTRIPSFYDFFGLSDADRLLGERLSAEAARTANGMTHQKDYEALAAVVLHRKPDLIFEIGTFLGVTSDFFLQLLPASRVVSIAYVNPKRRLFAKKYNQGYLQEEQVGSLVHESRRSRFTQLLGDSHKLTADELVGEHGRFDMVFIDGDHSRKGVAQDTALTQDILGDQGVICWHDANPRQRYMDVRMFLEGALSLKAVATVDDYIGGIACWSEGIQNRLEAEEDR